jgi:hypothetical protein
MLLQYDYLDPKRPHVSFALLLEHALNIAVYSGGQDKLTLALGPISSRFPDVEQKNVEVLQNKSYELSDEGWYVLDLISFRPMLHEIMTTHCPHGYPYDALKHFFVPLVESGRFPTLHFHRDWGDSIGATEEHQAALGQNLRCIYF